MPASLVLSFSDGSVTAPGTDSSSSKRPARSLRIVSRFFACYGLAVALVLYTPLTDWLARPLYVPPSSPAPVDAIVVLEAWAFDDGELNESGIKRALLGAELYREGIAKTVVITGLKATASRTGSALLPMARLVSLTGVPPPALLVEDESSNTHESAVRVAALSRAHGWKSILLVTDATHMRRAAGSFRKEGLAVACAPTLQWDIWGAKPGVRFRRVSTLLHEYAGLLYYRWQGWI